MGVRKSVCPLRRAGVQPHGKGGRLGGQEPLGDLAREIPLATDGANLPNKHTFNGRHLSLSPPIAEICCPLFTHSLTTSLCRRSPSLSHIFLPRPPSQQMT